MAAIYAGQYGPEGIEYSDGRPARNADVLVTRPTSGLPATIYSDELRTEVLDNPVQTDELGNLTFFAMPGRVTLTVNGYTVPALINLHPNDPGFGVSGDGQGGYTHIQSSPVNLMQITHNLPWNPGGIVLVDQDEAIQDFASVSHPFPGVTEIGFDKGYQFRGRVYLS